MKSSFGVLPLCILLLLPDYLPAHDHSEYLLGGDFVVSERFGPPAGDTYLKYTSFHDAIVDAIFVDWVSRTFGPSMTGDNTSIEVGLLPGWSVGVTINPFSAVETLFEDGSATLGLAVSARASLTPLYSQVPADSPIRLNLQEVATFTQPLGQSTSALISDIYSTLSATLDILTGAGFRLSLYTDGKLTTSIDGTRMNDRQKLPEYWDDSAQFSAWGMTAGPDYVVVVRPGSRVAIAGGVEVTLLQHWIFSAGYNWPLGVVGFHADSLAFSFDPLGSFDFSNFDFNASYKF